MPAVCRHHPGHGGHRAVNKISKAPSPVEFLSFLDERDNKQKGGRKKQGKETESCGVFFKLIFKKKVLWK